MSKFSILSILGQNTKSKFFSFEQSCFWKIEKVTLSVKSGDNYVIFCCGGYHSPFQTVSLAPDFQYRERKLEVVVCPSCGALLAELTQYNIKTQKYEMFRPKRKNVGKFILNIAEGKWQEIKIKYGTRQGAGFVFGENKEYKNGKIYQYAVNFNGEKKLVKVL